jgi:hypothetical protein
MQPLSSATAFPILKLRPSWERMKTQSDAGDAAVLVASVYEDGKADRRWYRRRRASSVFEPMFTNRCVENTRIEFA